ncbi:hypothetical protein PO909_022273 [Leuciscus waleckii]
MFPSHSELKNATVWFSSTICWDNLFSKHAEVDETSGNKWWNATVPDGSRRPPDQERCELGVVETLLTVVRCVVNDTCRIAQSLSF